MAKHKKDGRSSTSGTSTAAAKQANGSASTQIWKDERFAHLVNDPRFKGIPRAEKKVKIDKRFQSMFDDERFNVKQTVDKYGRKVKQGNSDELRKYYDVGSSAEEDEEAELEKEKDSDDGDADSDAEQQQSSGGESDSDGPELNEEEKAMSMEGNVKSRLKDLGVDYARGEGTIVSDSSSDDDSDDGEQSDDEVFIDHVWGELDCDAERTDETTRRLALCNVDWDRIRAVDIMVMLSSFLPRGSTILSVAIYPSEFGKQRMKEEEQSGPQELTGPVDSDESDDGEMNEEEKKLKQTERLREYQLNRLKYYYAVVECDRLETADKLYKECDGVEYESTANKIDLRFVPDDMDFDDEPKEKCTELPEVGKYEPRIFTTTALNQASVELTWDENDVDRKEFNEKIRAGKLSEVSDADLKKYVACSSSEEEEDEGESGPVETESEDESNSNHKSKKSRKQDLIAKYKALLGDIKEQDEKEKNDKVEMEFTWKVNEEGQQADQSDEDSESEATKKKRENVNPFEKILEKVKEKKKRRKELKKKKKRGELNSDGEQNEDSSDEDLPYGVDLNDPFFASAFDEKEFDLKKPSKKDKKKKKDKDADEEDEEEAARRRAELELMLDDGEDDRSHFNLKKIQEDEIDLKSVSKSKRKRILKKSKKQIEEQRQQKTVSDDFQIDLEDDRFKAIYEKADFNLDPTSSSFKKTKAMEQLIEEKLKKRPLQENDLPGEDDMVQVKKAKKDVSTSLLVKSIKRKIGK